MNIPQVSHAAQQLAGQIQPRSSRPASVGGGCTGAAQRAKKLYYPTPKTSSHMGAMKVCRSSLAICFPHFARGPNHKVGRRACVPVIGGVRDCRELGAKRMVDLTLKRTEKTQHAWRVNTEEHPHRDMTRMSFEYGQNKICRETTGRHLATPFQLRVSPPKRSKQ